MANNVDGLIQAYDKVVSGKWEETLSAQERIWFLVYDPDVQRKVDFRLSDFENVTKKAGKKWVVLSLKDCFPKWMVSHEYREEYFLDPEALVDQLEFEFKSYAIDYTISTIKENKNDEETVLAFTDVASLFGFARLSDLLNHIAAEVKGRLLVFFPGEFEKNQFRLLNARDGWSYLARPIKA